MKPNITIGGATQAPIWFKRLRNVLPLSLGVLMAMIALMQPTPHSLTK